MILSGSSINKNIILRVAEEERTCAGLSIEGMRAWKQLWRELR